MSRSTVRSRLGLRGAIRSGRLAAGEVLPSSRLLAEELGVSRGLVQGCYEQLVAEGYLVARTGSGTRVADRAGAPVTAHPPEPPVSPGFTVADFRPSVPDLASFPRQAWLRSGQQAMAQLGNAGLGYPDPAGQPRRSDRAGRLPTTGPSRRHGPGSCRALLGLRAGAVD